MASTTWQAQTIHDLMNPQQVSSVYKAAQSGFGTGYVPIFSSAYTGTITTSYGGLMGQMTGIYTDKTEVAPKPRQASAKSLVLQIDSLLGFIKKAKCIAN
jgi:hypothetical protein